jgi:hypothetical protein
MQFIRLKDDILIFVRAIQAVNIHKSGKTKLADGTEVDTKPVISVMLAMNAINVQYDTDEEACAQYAAIIKVLEVSHES